MDPPVSVSGMLTSQAKTSPGSSDSSGPDMEAMTSCVAMPMMG